MVLTIVNLGGFASNIRLFMYLYIFINLFVYIYLFLFQCMLIYIIIDCWRYAIFGVFSFVVFGVRFIFV